MDFRTFPQRKPGDRPPPGPPVFGRRDERTEKTAWRFSVRGVAGTAAFGVAAATLVYLMIETL